MVEEEYGRIKKSDSVEIVIKRDDYGGKPSISIREYVTSKTFTGFTKNGTRIPLEKWEEFKEIVKKIKV
ncbi:MAG: transcriptional coactivator p15/PC4 family protein [Leptospiraceae bacterium]|nr:transcriptional coactivator p15/PC4 family protein [Leptospiraceae bacterium]